jgi:hypothetical protein
MTDTRQIFQKAANHVANEQTPTITVDAPVTKEISAGTSGTLATSDQTTPAVVVNAPVVRDISAGDAAPPTITTRVADVAVHFTATNMGEDSIPDPRLFKFLSEQFGFSEQKLIQVYKNLSDLTTTQEQVQKLLQKTLADITSNSDIFNRVWTAYRTHTDSTTNTELLQKEFQKVLQDIANAPDLLQSSIGKYLTDITALANLSYAVLLVGKDLQDQTIGFTDVLSRIVEFNRIFEDTAFMTDDFLGAANIDDDQYAHAYKVLLEWVRPQERFSVDLDKPDVSDSAALAEQAYLEPQLAKFDAVSAAELATALVQPVKLDQTSNYEQQFFSVTKPDIVDQILATEQASVDLDKRDLAHSTAVSDLQISEVGQTSQDQLSVQNEQYSFDVSKADRVDVATVYEQVAKNIATPADSDTVSVAQLLFTKLIGLNINEIDYFLEDYVFDTTDYTFKAVHASDQITDVVVAKQIEDLIDATDDFYGAANIDDDQIAAFDKVLADYVTFAEAFSRLVSYIRLFSETAELLDQVKLSTTKVVSDQTGNSELFKLDAEKVTNDQTTTSEVRSFEVTQISADTATSLEQAYLAVSVPQTDAVTNADEFSKFYQAVRVFAELTQTTDRVEQLVEKVSLDQTTFIELVTQTVEKLLLDQIANSEQLTFDFQANYSDLVDATDDFYGAANIDDDQIAAIGKVLVDYISNSETVITVAEFYRTFLEIATNSDQTTLDFAKAVVDLVSLSEVLALYFATSRTEIINTSEEVAASFSTSRIETVIQTDLFTQSIEPAKYETVYTAEQSTYDVGLAKSETTTTAEVVEQDFSTARYDTAYILELFISEWEVLRNFSESVQQSDAADLHTGKNAIDLVSNSDTQTFDTNKQPLDTATTSEIVGKHTTTEFSDLVDATDDFYGAANIDDDQYATINKVVADYVNNSDTVTTLTDFLRSVNESQILSEVFAAANDKALSDIINSSDTVILLTASNKLEAVSTSQTISLTLQSYFSQDYAQLGYTGETYTY